MIKSENAGNKTAIRPHRLGQQRDWAWRGWQTRYTYLRSPNVTLNQRPPLILLHGFGASITHWRHNLAALSQSQSVYALDLLGFGASEKALTDYNINLWVAQVYDFWRSLIGRPVVLVGNSIGSLVCLAAAMAHPDMVAGIAMLSLPDTSVRSEMIPKFVQPIVSAIEGLFTSSLLLKPIFYWVRRPQIVRPWAAIAYANPAAIDDELIESLVTPAGDLGAAVAFAAIIKAMTSPKFGPKVSAVLPGLEMPILLIWGQQDRMIPPSLGQQFASYNPKVKLVELEDAGHCPQDEQPEQVNQAILDWLQSWFEVGDR
jgi:pimeloyl-ACP methyl ester carboxylesterase